MFLHVELQEGFSHDIVVVLVDGRQVFRKQDVSTNLSAGIADSIEVNTDGHLAEVEIQILSRLKFGSKEVDLRQHPHVAISIDPEGQPEIRSSP
jgi:hypothetical protein